MANTKISNLPAATTPVAGTEVLPIVQSSTTVKVSIANLTAGRAVSALSYDATGSTAPANGMFSTTSNNLSFSTASGQVANFNSSASGGSFNVDDASSTGYNGQRYIEVRNKNTGTSAYAWVGANSQNVKLLASAFSPSFSTTALANKAVLFGADSVGASSGTAIADFSTGANQIQFYLGSLVSPTPTALLSSNGFSVSDFSGSTGTNAQRYIEVRNPSTGTSAYSWVGAQAVNVWARANAFSSSYTSATFANKAAFYGLDSVGASSGTIFGDFSTGTNQIQFYVGTIGSPTLAGTINSSGNWDLGAKTVTTTGTITGGAFSTSGNSTASAFIPSGSTVPTNGMFLPAANQIGFSTASGQVAQFYSSAVGGSLEIDDASSTGYNGQRYLNVRNKNTGTSAWAWVGANAANVNVKLAAFSPSHSSSSLANKSVLLGADGTSAASGTAIADFSTGTNRIQFYVGTSASPTLAATFDSGAVFTLTNNPVLSGGTANGVAYLNASKVLTTGSALVFDSSNNLGVGVTPSGAKLHLGGAGTSSITMKVSNDGGNVYFGKEGSAGGSIITGSAAYAGIVGVGNAYSLQFATNDAIRATIDSSGNFGLGVTPSAWLSSNRAFQVGYGAVRGFTSSANTYLENNNYVNTSGTDIYLNNGYAARYRMSDNQHIWYQAGSGTAGNAITFTQAMTLDGSGNLGVGTTTMNNKVNILAPADDGLRLTSASASVALVMAGVTENRIQGVTNVPLTFYTNGSERARIDSSGNFRVGVGTTTTNTYMDVNHATGSTNGASFFVARYNGTQIGDISQATTSTVAYNTSSDYRLKENIQPMTGALDKVALLKPCTYTWKTDGAAGQGFIAHELQEVVPDCVTGAKDAVETYIDDEGVEQTRPKYQGIDTSFLVATLTAAIQEQQAIIQTLTARIEALEKV